MLGFNNQKSDKRGHRFDFHFSNLYATQVPKGWDKLGVSIVSTESGKISWESLKAPVLRGCCRWSDTVSESIWIDDPAASHLFKFVVSTEGWPSLSSRNGVVLGEATVNLGDYTTSLKTCCVDVSLVLEKCSYKTILQMKIECTISPPNNDTTCVEEMESSSSLSSSEEEASSYSLDSSSSSCSFGRHSFSLHRNLSTTSPTNSNSYSFHNQHLYQNTHLMEEQDEEGIHIHHKELEEQLKFLKESNSNLSLQLYKTQQSNIDLLSVLQEMEQTIENQRIAATAAAGGDRELMQSLKNKVDDLESDCTDLTNENLQLVFNLKQMEKELELQQEDFMIKHLFYQQLSTKHTADQQSHQAAAVDIDDGCKCESSVDEGSEMTKGTYFITQRGQHQTILNKLADLTNLVVTKDDDYANATAESIIVDDNVLQSIDHQLGNLHQILESRVQKEMTSLEGERAEARSKEEEIKVLRNEKTELETMLNSVGDEKHQLEVQLSKLGASMELECNQSELEAHLCEVEDENLRLSERICGLEAQLRYLTNEKEASRSVLHHSESRCSELEQHVKELEDEVKEREKKAYEMQMQVLEAMEECGFLRVMHQKMQATAETVMEECRSLEESNLELKSHKMELHERCNLLEAELNDSRSSFDNLLEEIQVLREKLVSLSEETNHKERALNAELESLILETTTISTNSLILLLQGVDIPSLRKEEEEEVKLKDDDSETRLRDELAVSKQNEEVLISDREKLLGLVEDLKSKESRTKEKIRSLEMKLKASEFKRKELVEDVTTLKVKLSRSQAVERNLEEAMFEKQRVEASLEVIKRDYERVKKEKGLIGERMSRLEREVLKLEVCRNQKEVLEDRVLRLEGDLTAKEALCSEEAELKNELARVRRENKQLQRRLLAQQEVEEEEQKRKKNSSVSSSYCSSSSSSCIVEEDDNSWVGDRESNNTPKREVADDNDLLKKKIQLLEDQLNSKDGDMEKELMELRESYFNMSLKYALVEAEREHLVMKLRSK